MKSGVIALFFLGLITATQTEAGQPLAYAINASGETISRINLTTGEVANNILTLGSDIYCFPNQIIIRDTLAYILLSGTAEIQVININTETTVDWILLPPGSNPFWMDFLDERYLYVTLMMNGALAKVDLISGQTVTTVPVGMSPEGIVIRDRIAFIAVTAYDFSTYAWGQGKIVAYDTDGDTVMTDREVLVGKNPQFLDFDRRGILHCICTGDYWAHRGMAYRVDPLQSAIIDSAFLGGDPSLLAVGADDMVYISAGGWTDDGELFAYEAETFVIRHDAENPIHVDSGAMGIVAFQDTTIFACTFGDRIFRIDSNGDKTATYTLGDGPIHLDFNYCPGDANGDWEVDVGDAVYLVNYTFKGGSAPAYPHWRANVNGDEAVNVGDAVYLISYIFKSGQSPQMSSRSVW